MKRPIQLTAILLIALVSVVLFSCKPRPGAGKTGNDTTIAFVYKFGKQAALTSEESAKTLMQLMDLKEMPKVTVNNENTVYYSDPEDASVFFEQNLTTGNLTLSKSLKEYYGAFVPELPPRAEAEKIALEYLKKYQLVPPDDSRMKLVHQGGLRATSVVEGKKQGPVIDKLITLNYGRFLDSVQIIGPGSKLVISLGNKGEVMKVVRRWRPIETSSRTVVVKQEELVMPTQAEGLLKEHMTANFGEQVTYRILNRQLVYYDGNGTLVQPVYAFETMVMLSDSIQPFKFVSIIPRLKNPGESIILQLDPEAKKLIKNFNEIRQTEPPDKND